MAKDWFTWLFPEKFYTVEGVKQRTELNDATRVKNENLLIARQERLDDLKSEAEASASPQLDENGKPKKIVPQVSTFSTF
jgi:hypothetical protein